MYELKENIFFKFPFETPQLLPDRCVCLLSSANPVKPRNQIEHQHLHSYSTVIFTQFFYHHNHQNPASHQKRMSSKVPVMVNALAMNSVRCHCAFLGNPESLESPVNSVWCPRYFRTQFGNSRLCVTYVVQAHELNPDMSEPRFMSFFFFFFVTVLLDRINFDSV